MVGLGTTAKEATIPGMLNVLEGAAKVMLFCAAVSDAVAKGVC